MGGVPQTVKTLALAALACCAAGVSCADGDGEGDVRAGGGRSAPTRVSVRNVETNAGGGAESDVPNAASGAPHQQPLDTTAGGQGEPGSAPVDGSAGEPPSCGNRSGAVCGANMVPASDPAMRFFCSGGVLTAQARCPGVCLMKSNACGMGSGTGGGSDETPLGVWLHCRECLSVDCKAPLVACDADPWCAAHMDCKESCTIDEPCLSTCAAVFAEDPLMDELELCAQRTECAPACAKN